MKALLLIGAITILMMTEGCAPHVKYMSVELPLPPEITGAERLTNGELECVSDTTYHKIILLDNRRLTLRRIIKATHQQTTD